MKNLIRPLHRNLAALAAIAGLLFASGARADIHVGVILSLTGPGASLGIPAGNTVRLWPAEIGGQKLKYTVFNDSTDPTEAVKAAVKLMSEERVDVIVGPSLTPASLAVLEKAAEHGTPMISLAGGGAIVNPMTGSRRWAFKVSPPEAVSSGMVLDHLVKNKGKTLATIGIATAYGEGYLKAVEAAAGGKGIRITTSERYNQTDQSVVSQVLKILATNPDAVYIFSAGTPGALPQIELARRGYKGAVYQTQGVANTDFLRVGGKDLEGAFMTVAPVLVAEQLPESNLSRASALDYVRSYEAKHGPGSRSLFGASAWSAMMFLGSSVPVALGKAKPGTAEFRAALRDALEGMRDVVTPEGVFNMSDRDHNGVDSRCQVMVRIEGGQWKLVR